MNQLFIHLYLDEDVSVVVAQLVRSRGFDATTTLDEGQLHNSDAAQLAYAAERNRARLRITALILKTSHANISATGRNHAGVIIAVRRAPYEIARRLLLILNDVTAEEMANQVRYI